MAALPPDDDGDVARAKLGDAEALERLLARNHRRLVRLARTRLGEGLRARVRISDLIQSTYLEVVRGIDRFAGPDEDAFVSWAGSILLNNIRDKKRYYAAQKRTDGAPHNGRTSAVVDPAPGPPSRTTTEEELVLVHEAMRRMTGDMQQVLLMRLKEGRSHREIAEIMGRSESGVRTLLTRARVALLVEVRRLQRDVEEKPGES